eukprot:6183869-Pleurochrysis_carterae.AAC.4
MAKETVVLVDHSQSQQGVKPRHTLGDAAVEGPFEAGAAGCAYGALLCRKMLKARRHKRGNTEYPTETIDFLGELAHWEANYFIVCSNWHASI